MEQTDKSVWDIFRIFKAFLIYVVLTKAAYNKISHVLRFSLFIFYCWNASSLCFPPSKEIFFGFFGGFSLLKIVELFTRNSRRNINQDTLDFAHSTLER
jgi:hypothetical protein